MWVDGTSVTYTSWGLSMPEILDGGCVRLDRSLYGQWADKKCDSAYGSVCKLTLGEFENSIFISSYYNIELTTDNTVHIGEIVIDY